MSLPRRSKASATGSLKTSSLTYARSKSVSARLSSSLALRAQQTGASAGSTELFSGQRRSEPERQRGAPRWRSGSDNGPRAGARALTKPVNTSVESTPGGRRRGRRVVQPAAAPQHGLHGSALVQHLFVWTATLLPRQ